MSLRVTLLRLLSDLSRRQKRAVFLMVDMAFAPISLFFVLLPDRGLQSVPTLAVFAGLSAISISASAALGLDRIKLNAYGRHAMMATAKFSILVVLGLTVLSHIARFPIGPFQLAEFGTVLFFGCIAGRYAMLVVLVWVLRQGNTRCRVLIYGAGDTGQQMAAALRNHVHLLAVAFLDDDVDLQGVTVAGLPVLSPARLEIALRDLNRAKLWRMLPYQKFLDEAESKVSNDIMQTLRKIPY